MAKPATYGCEKCQISYKMGHETVVHLFLRQPWFNHINTVCPKCKTAWVVWELEEVSIRYMEDNNQVEGDKIRWEVETDADDNIWQMYCAATGKPYPKPPQLSHRAEKHIEAEVNFFRYLLENGEYPA